jgi:glyoxylase-like metal-dependent hydrolase (beta-lactamase superfamily II)
MTSMRTRFHRVELESGYVVGSVNVWLVDGEPFTLVDGGSLLPGAVERLEAACAALGRRVEEIEQVVITHHHVDHVGLAAEVVRRSGARVAALGLVADYLGDYDAHVERDVAFAAEALERHGFPPTVARETGARLGREARWATGVRVDRRLATGDAVAIGSGTFEVLHRPGHSETDTVFLDAENGIVISGDHLMRDHASMPMTDRPIGALDRFSEEAARCERLVAYRRSLTASLDDLDGFVVPGHGAPFERPHEAIARHLAFQEEQARKVLDLFAPGEALSACAVAERLWPRTAFTWPWLSASTILGLLGWLAADERLVPTRLDGDLIGYRPR